VGTVTVAALAAGLGFGHIAWRNSPSSGSASLYAPMSTSTDVSSTADKVDPGLVDIDTLLGFQQEEAAGTGIVLTSSGEVLTNNHVINGATAISVRDIANGKAYSATVVGYDTTKDVAVLQLHDASGLQTASIGNSSNVSVGETVVGIGNAGGTGGTPSAAGGTVTGLNQSITATDEGDGSSEQLTDLIETNAEYSAGGFGGFAGQQLGTSDCH
jgi:S1-C subfamily serine protease